MKCEHPRCHRRARYDSPGIWCGTHWKMWWDWGLKHGRFHERTPKWMLEPKSRRDAKAQEALEAAYERAAFHNT